MRWSGEIDMIRHIPSMPRFTASMLCGRCQPDSPVHLLPAGRAWLTHRGRTAVRRAAELAGLAGGGEVLAPSYHCGSEIDALLSAGSDVRFYRIDEAGQLDLSDLASRITPATRAIYLTHLFGFTPPVEAVRMLARQHQLTLIEDRALSSLSDMPAASADGTGDLAIYSFTKNLPLPDGGALVVRSDSLSPVEWNLKPLSWRRQSRLAWLMTRKAMISRVRKALHRPLRTTCSHPPPEQMPAAYRFRAEYGERAMSSITLRMLHRISARTVRLRRRSNFEYLAGLLRPLMSDPSRLTHLSPGVSPLMYPVLVARRADVLARLHAQGVGACAFWSGYHPSFPLHDYPGARRLKDHLVGLPVHQDLDHEDMEYVARVFRAAMRC